MEHSAEDPPETPSEDGSRRCLYCFQELNEMTDPRQLPCNHIVCLACLQNDWKLDELECRACRKEIKIRNLDQLPQVTIEIPAAINFEQPKLKPAVNIQCDICGHKASDYCIDCDKSCCEQHMKTHQDFFKVSHETVKISVFADRPGFYRNVACQRHVGEFIHLICQKCDDMACISCLANQSSCKYSGSHQYQTLKLSRATIQSEFDTKLKTISDKITALCNLEKETWLTVDKLDEDCERMVTQVDKDIGKLITEIQLRGCEAKKAITKYRADRMSQVEEYIKALTEKVESLESTQQSITSFLRAHHVTDVARRKVKMCDELRSKINLDTSTKYDCSEMRLLTSCEIVGDMEMITGQQWIDTSSVVTCYKEINFNTRLSLTYTACHSLGYNEIGELLFGSHNKVFLSYVETFQWRSAVAFPGQVVICVAQHGLYIYVLLRNGSVYRIAESGEKVALFKNNTISALSVMRISNNCLIVSVGENKLAVYNSFSGVKQEIILIGVKQVSSLCFDLSGSLLVLDGSQGVIFKYQISGKKSISSIWRCNAVSGGLAICGDTSGRSRLIYVYATTQKIYILDPETGSVVNTLSSPQLPKHTTEARRYCSIAVYNQKLAITENNSPHFCVFDLQ